MRTLQLLVVIGFFVVFTAGCTVKQQFTFNSDLSGKAVNEVDLSTMRTLLPRFDSTRQFTDIRDSVWQYTGRIADSLKSLHGVEAVKYQWNDSTSRIILSYKYADLNALNRAFAVSLQGNCPEAGCFSKKWNRLTFSAPQFHKISRFTDSLKENTKQHFHYVLRMEFANGIRKVKGNALPTANNNGVRYRNNLFETFGSPSTVSFKAMLR